MSSAPITLAVRRVPEEDEESNQSLRSLTESLLNMINSLAPGYDPATLGAQGKKCQSKLQQISSRQLQPASKTFDPALKDCAERAIAMHRANFTPISKKEARAPSTMVNNTATIKLEKPHFPAQKELASCIKQHPLIRDDRWLNEKKIVVETVANRLANQDVLPESVEKGVTQSLADVQGALGLRAEGMVSLHMNLTDAAQSCALGKIPEATVQPSESRMTHEDLDLFDP